MSKIAMRQLHPQPGGAELRGQPLGHIDRAMSAAGAADGDRQIGLAFLLVARQQRPQEPPQPVEKGRKSGSRSICAATAGSRPVSGRSAGT